MPREDLLKPLRGDSENAHCKQAEPESEEEMDSSQIDYKLNSGIIPDGTSSQQAVPSPKSGLETASSTQIKQELVLNLLDMTNTIHYTIDMKCTDAKSQSNLSTIVKQFLLWLPSGPQDTHPQLVSLQNNPTQKRVLLGFQLGENPIRPSRHTSTRKRSLDLISHRAQKVHTSQTSAQTQADNGIGTSTSLP